MVQRRYKKLKKRGRTVGLNAAVRAAKQAYRSEHNQQLAITKALRAARRRVSPRSREVFRRRARVIPIPKRRGGFLPALFAGLAALGSLIGGASAVAKAVKSSEEAREQLRESERHNKMMESIALRGKGVHMKPAPYKRGLGLFMTPQKTSVEGTATASVNTRGGEPLRQTTGDSPFPWRVYA